MAIIDEKTGHWVNGQGEPVPPANISKYDREADKMVEEIDRLYVHYNLVLGRLKFRIHNKIENFIKRSQKKYSKRYRGVKGNYSFWNFSKNKKVELKQKDNTSFDSRINEVIELINKCIAKWTEGNHQPVALIIKSIFDQAKGGKLPIAGLKTLKNLKGINDPDWTAAMELLDECEFTYESKYFINHYRRDLTNPEKPLNGISLDFARIPAIPPKKKGNK